MSVLARPEPEMGPIMDACHEQDAVALRRALAAGGDVNVRELGGWTPIHKVLYRGDNAEMVCMLLKAGVDVNACSIANCTHLHLAVSEGRVDCVAALLAAGASLTVKYGVLRETPLDSVTNRQGGFRRILPMLLRAGSDMPSLDRLSLEEDDDAVAFPHFTLGSDRQSLQNYLKKILMSGPSSGLGTFATYEKAHREKLARVFVPKFPQIPAEIVPTIVAYAFHTGWY